MKLQLRQVSFAHPGGSKQNVIEDLDCTFHEGEVTLLVGATGAGKSTLLQLLAGLLKPAAGEVLYDGQSIWKGNRVSPGILLQSGIVFQSPEHQLFARTVGGEFRYSLKPYHLDTGAATHRMKHALAQIGLPLDILPSSPHLLSGGQKRRLALATTLSTEPAWLFLDEPSAGLDTQGIEQLKALLSGHKLARQNTGGIVIATHDLDSFFPIADHVLVMVNGKIVAVDTPAALCQQPAVLLEAGVGLPYPAQIAIAAARAGRSLTDIPFGAEQMARALVDANKAIAPAFSNAVTREQPDATFAAEHHSPVAGATPQHAAEQPLLSRIDARAKWLAYFLLTIGTFVQQGTAGLMLASLIVAVLMVVCRVNAGPFIQVMKPFLLLFFVSVALSGLRFGHSAHALLNLPFYYSAAEGLVTFHALYKVFLVMLLGILFSTTTSQLQMKDGLHRSLSVLSRLGVPVEAFALGAALVLRFIPVIMRDLERFSAVVRARGKAPVKPGVLRVRDVPALIVPLILSVFQLGEKLSLALEARGYTETGAGGAVSMPIKLMRRDYWVIFTGVMLLGGLWAVRRL